MELGCALDNIVAVKVEVAGVPLSIPVPSFSYVNTFTLASILVRPTLVALAVAAKPCVPLYPVTDALGQKLEGIFLYAEPAILDAGWSVIFLNQ